MKLRIKLLLWSKLSKGCRKRGNNRRAKEQIVAETKND